MCYGILNRMNNFRITEMGAEVNASQ